MMSTSQNFLEITTKLFHYYKDLAERAMGQLADNDLHFRRDESCNNIATLIHHMSGNMLSRFTDFLTTDGEKEWRNRDQEFEDLIEAREDLMAAWEQGWSCLFDTLKSLEPSDLERIVFIRNEGHTVLEALSRQLAHYSYHCGQIVHIAKDISRSQFSPLSIPKGGSAQYNEGKFAKETARGFFTDHVREGLNDAGER